jgi:hypothetical protein
VELGAEDEALVRARISCGDVVSVRYSVISGSKRAPAGSTAERSRYAAAIATVVTGGRFGMMIARAN